MVEGLAQFFYINGFIIQDKLSDSTHELGISMVAGQSLSHPSKLPGAGHCTNNGLPVILEPNQVFKQNCIVYIEIKWLISIFRQQLMHIDVS